MRLSGCCFKSIVCFSSAGDSLHTALEIRGKVRRELRRRARRRESVPALEDSLLPSLERTAASAYSSLGRQVVLQATLKDSPLTAFLHAAPPTVFGLPMLSALLPRRILPLPAASKTTAIFSPGESEVDSKWGVRASAKRARAKASPEAGEQREARKAARADLRSSRYRSQAYGRARASSPSPTRLHASHDRFEHAVARLGVRPRPTASPPPL